MYDYLIDHVGHHIVITHYKEIDEVAVECEDCYEVLLSFRKDDDEEDGTDIMHPLGGGKTMYVNNLIKESED